MKIVINDCIGGFGISHFGMVKYVEHKYGKCFVYAFNNGGFNKVNDVPENTPSVFLATDLGDRIYDEHIVVNKIFEDEIKRNDESLIYIVETHGELINDSYSNLKIVEIPDDVKWHIGEGEMGGEWIYEEHRTWS